MHGPIISIPACSDDFTKETGIKIAYDTYDTGDALDARLVLGHSGNDVVVIPGPLLQKKSPAVSCSSSTRRNSRQPKGSGRRSWHASPLMIRATNMP